MSTRQVSLFLLVLVTIATSPDLYARDYTLSDDGRLRFYNEARSYWEWHEDKPWIREEHWLHIEMLDGDASWTEFYSYKINWMGNPKVQWKQESPSNGRLRTFIELPDCFERHSNACESVLIMIEIVDRGFRIYPKEYPILQVDRLNHATGRYENFSQESIENFCTFDLKFGLLGELMLNRLPYAGDWVTKILLSSSDVEAFGNS